MKAKFAVKASEQAKHVMETETQLDLPAPAPQARQLQLCTSCAAPNEPNADFCVKCGAPISWYSKIGPFESIFAQGFILREAAGRPRRLIVVLGIWLIFLPQALGGLVFIPFGTTGALYGGAVSLIAIAIISRTTWNYLSERLNRPGADQSDAGTNTGAA